MKILSVTQLLDLFGSVRFRFNSEVDLQNGIELVLKRAEASFQRELALCSKDRPDFVVDGGIAIEVKIQGTFAQAARQIDRYAKHDNITSIILIGSPAWITRLPAAIGGKPVYAIRLTESLL